MTTREIAERKYYRPIDVIKMTRLSKSTVMQAIWSGRLKAYRVGRSWLVPVEEVEQWIRANNGTPARAELVKAAPNAPDGIEERRCAPVKASTPRPKPKQNVTPRVLRILKGDGGEWVRRADICKRLGNVQADDLTKSLERLEADGAVERRTITTATRPAEEWRLSRPSVEDALKEITAAVDEAARAVDADYPYFAPAFEWLGRGVTATRPEDV